LRLAALPRHEFEYKYLVFDILNEDKVHHWLPSYKPVDVEKSLEINASEFEQKKKNTTNKSNKADKENCSPSVSCKKAIE
jgi:hypothetical protein